MSASRTLASACTSTLRFAIDTRWSKGIMGVSAIEDDGRHRRKRADARRRWKGGAPGMLAARVAEGPATRGVGLGKSTYEQ